MKLNQKNLALLDSHNKRRYFFIKLYIYKCILRNGSLIFFDKRRGRDSRGYVLLAYLLDLSIWIILYLSRGKINSTFPSCIWLLRGSCLELYSYCLFRGHGIVFFFLPRLFSQGSGQGCVCVWGSAQDHSLG